MNPGQLLKPIDQAVAVKTNEGKTWALLSVRSNETAIRRGSLSNTGSTRGPWGSERWREVSKPKEQKDAKSCMSDTSMTDYSLAGLLLVLLLEKEGVWSIVGSGASDRHG